MDQEVEIGYGLGKEFENNGYMTEAVQALNVLHLAIALKWMTNFWRWYLPERKLQQSWLYWKMSSRQALVIYLWYSMDNGSQEIFAIGHEMLPGTVILLPIKHLSRLKSLRSSRHFKYVALEKELIEA